MPELKLIKSVFRPVAYRFPAIIAPAFASCDKPADQENPMLFLSLRMIRDIVIWVSHGMSISNPPTSISLLLKGFDMKPGVTRLQK